MVNGQGSLDLLFDVPRFLSHFVRRHGTVCRSVAAVSCFLPEKRLVRVLFVIRDRWHNPRCVVPRSCVRRFFSLSNCIRMCASFAFLVETRTDQRE